MKTTDIKHLNSLLLRDIHKILPLFKIEYKELDDRYEFRCPIHNGKKNNSCCIYKDSGLWFCWTHSCHELLQTNLFALFKHLLKLSPIEMIQWCNNFYDNKIEKVDINYKQNSFSHIVDILDKKLEKVGISPKVVKESLRIPSEYFIKRGFSSDILSKYDVGECITFGKEMYNRAVVPVYDIGYELMVGCLGRRINEEDSDIKWKNSKNFKKSDSLYNIWFAKKHICNTNTVVITEGQGDVWRLEESGIHNAVGIFGASISDNQMYILEKLPIMNMVVLTDSDTAGQLAKNRIYDKCKRLYNMYSIDLKKKDIGEMSIEEVKQEILPIMEKI